MTKEIEKLFKHACKKANLRINGPGDADPQILSPKEFYKALEKNPYLGFGEAYAANFYDVKKLDEMLFRLTKLHREKQLPELSFLKKTRIALYHTKRKLGNPQLKKGFEVGQKHYDIGNELLEHMTGKWCKYTSAYWTPQLGRFDLNLAQELCIKIICERLGLKKGMKVLDIGFGYGRITRYMVEHYGVHVTGISVSKEQIKSAKEHCRDIEHNVRFILGQWDRIPKKVLGKFDRVVSIEMIEAVGPKNFEQFFSFIHSVLKEEGSALIQAINWNKVKYETNPFIDKYIFPNGVIPQTHEMLSAALQSKLTLRFVDNSLSYSYDLTLQEWAKRAENFLEKNNDEYKNQYKGLFPYTYTDETFKRIWKFYLLSCAATNRSGVIQNGHFIFEKNPINTAKQDINIPQSRKELKEFLTF